MSRPSVPLLSAILVVAAAGAAILLSGCSALGPNRGGGREYDYSMKPKPNDFDRAGFGAASLPLWSALTPPEQRALAGRDKAAAGDADALLDLAIFASGTPRDMAGYDSIHRKVDAFLAKARPEVDKEANAYRKGMRLFQAMHQEFFPAPNPTPAAQGTEDAAPAGAGYEFHQSALVPIFTQRKFNCISSAILYAVLARHFGLQVKGVTLTSHAFIQLETPDGKVIEVETTTPTGYDWVHDEGFYKKRALAWFSARGLPASSYEDYRKREIVTPLELVAHNLNNQHMAPARMAQVDRCRLIEAYGYLAPKDRDAQRNRLAFYNDEYLWLKGKKDFKTLEALFSKVKPELSVVRAAWREDADMSNRVGWAWFEYASALHEQERGLEGIPYVDSSISCMRKDDKEGVQLQANNVAMVQMVAGALGEKQRFAEAEGLLARYPKFSEEDAGYRRTRSWLHNKWAVELWNKEDWQGAVDQFEKQKAVGTISDRKSVMDNMTNAYLNWAAGYQNQGDWPRTRDVLAKCVEKTDARKCRTLLEQVVAQHRME